MLGRTTRKARKSMKADVYWVGRVGRGRLAIMPHPRGHDRLEDEVRALREEGVDVVVSLLTREEVGAFGLAREEALCLGAGMAFLSHPIRDRSVPVAQAETLAF